MEDGGHVLSSHSDGSYCRWKVAGDDPQSEQEKSEVPYGEDPQKVNTTFLSVEADKTQQRG